MNSSAKSVPTISSALCDFPSFWLLYLGKSGELSSSISGAEWRETEEVALATQLRFLEKGDFLLQVDTNLGKKTNKDLVSEEEVGIYSSLEAEED